MAELPHCVVCDDLLPPYGQAVRCDRCSNRCGECGQDVALCQHRLTSMVERELKRTIELNARAA